MRRKQTNRQGRSPGDTEREAALGRECLGAIRITSAAEPNIEEVRYEKLAAKAIRELAKEGQTESVQLITKAHLSLTGASGKAGLYYLAAKNSWYLPLGLAPSTHIVKQSHVRLDNIVTNEQLCMMTAANLGIPVPESFILQTTGEEEAFPICRSHQTDFSVYP